MNLQAPSPSSSVSPSSSSCDFDLVRELGVVEVGVEAAASSSSAWRPRSTIRPPSTTRIWSASLHGGEPVGDHERRPPGQDLFERPLDRDFGFRVEVGRGFVQHHEVRSFEQQAGYGNALLFAARTGGTRGPLPVCRARPGEPSTMSRICASRRASMSSCFGRLGPGIKQVGPQSVVEKVGLLRNYPYRLLERAQRDVPDVYAVELH